MDDEVFIIVKSPKKSERVSIHPHSTVFELKTKISALFNAEMGSLCLVTAGKIMKDNDKVSHHVTKSESVVHVIIKNKTGTLPKVDNVKEKSQKESQSDIKQGQGEVSANAGDNLVSTDNVKKFAEILKFLPPNILDEAIKNNPVTKKMLDENPELRSSINANSLKKMTEILTNPAMAEEFARSQENTLRQLQNIPGAMNQLERMLGNFDDLEGSRPNNQPYQASTMNPTNSVPNVSGNPIPSPWSGSTSSQAKQGGGSALKQSNNKMETNILSERLENMWKDESNQQIAGTNFNKELMEEVLSPDVMKIMASLTENIKNLKEKAPNLYKNMGLPENPELNKFENISNFLSGSKEEPTEEALDKIDQVMLERTLNLSIDHSLKNLSNEQLKVKFSEELKTLKSMGFYDDELNIKALVSSNGNINNAVDWLLRNLL